jgi:hypothetical protein
MQLSGKKLALLPCLLFAGWIGASPAEAGTLGYPTTDHASFLVEIPDSWEVTPGEEIGDYVHVNSPSGVYLAFRTMPASESAMDDSIDEAIAYLEANYDNVAVDEPRDAKQAGLEGFYMDGSGKDADGTAVSFRMAFLALDDGSIGEIWFAAPAKDKAGIAAAAKALNSFRAPK